MTLVKAVRRLLSLAVLLGSLSGAPRATAEEPAVEQWGTFEVALHGPAAGEEQPAFWNALNRTPRPTGGQRRLGSVMRGEP
jgi:hypothetical protein